MSRTFFLFTCVNKIMWVIFTTGRLFSHANEIFTGENHIYLALFVVCFFFSCGEYWLLHIENVYVQWLLSCVAVMSAEIFVKFVFHHQKQHFSLEAFNPFPRNSNEILHWEDLKELHSKRQWPKVNVEDAHMTPQKKKKKKKSPLKIAE